MQESDCKVTDYGSHAQRSMTRNDGNVVKDTVMFEEEMGEITFVDVGKMSDVLP